MDDEGGSIWVFLRKRRAALVSECGVLGTLYVFVSIYDYHKTKNAIKKKLQKPIKFKQILLESV